MEYTINKLAKLAGVTTRTLRHYDSEGLLCPARVSSNGYRIYGQKEVDKLQQILFYRELGMSLEEIKNILLTEKFSTTDALKSHLKALTEKRNQLDTMIAKVEKLIDAEKRGICVSDEEKFAAFKQELIDENEKKYGKEIREKYGDEAVDKSNEKLKEMSKEEYEEAALLTDKLNAALAEAVLTGDPAGDLAQKVCEMHKDWISLYWNTYTKQAHIGLTKMYAEDARFKAYYDNIAPGSAEFLRDAMVIYTKK